MNMNGVTKMYELSRLFRGDFPGGGTVFHRRAVVKVSRFTRGGSKVNTLSLRSE